MGSVVKMNKNNEPIDPKGHEPAISPIAQEPEKGSDIEDVQHNKGPNQGVEKAIKVKYEKILTKEVENHKFTGNLANTTLLLSNMRKLKAASNLLESGMVDPFEAVCCRWIIPLTVVLQIFLLFLNTTNANFDKMIGAKAMSKYPDKQERAKWINF